MTILTLNIYKNAKSEFCCYKLLKLYVQTKEICYEHHDLDSSCKREDCIPCIPPFKVYCFPSIWKNAELRSKWIRALKRQDKDKTEWKPSESDRVCSIRITGSTYEANSVPTLNLVYEIEEKKGKRTCKIKV